MAAPFVSAEINRSDIQLLNQRLEKLASAMSNLTPANREASIALYGLTIRNFDNQGGPGAKWAPLAASTIRQKARIGKEKMLVRTGNMRAGFHSFYSRENAGVGNAVTYSLFHHEGTTRTPKRELLPRQDAVIELGIKVYGAYVARQVREANGGL
jgi:phage gpG-like protein